MEPNQTITTDVIGRLRLCQPAEGYRFCLDSILLAFFAAPRQGPVADLGAGCGIINILLKERGFPGPFTGIELDQLAAQCCRHNYASAGLAGCCLQADIMQPHSDLSHGSFSLVISNPPFGLPGRGRLPQNAPRARARHQLSLNLADLCQRARQLLRSKGSLTLCLPPRWLDLAWQDLSDQGFTLKRMRLVYGRLTRPASLVLLEAIKKGGHELTIEPPLIVYAQGQKYSPEVEAIFNSLS